MSDTFSKLFFHVVFSTKERIKFLKPDLRVRLFEYMGGIAKNNNFQTVFTNGIDDHLHTLLLLKPNMAVSKAVQLLKGGSSKWIHDNFSDLKMFTWQSGFGAFSVSHSQVAKVIEYISKQEEHHKKMDFKDEYKKLLKINNIDYKEQYLF